MYDGSRQHALLAYKFTGKEHDNETGLDNFGARYDSSQYGRFMTPDWSAKPQGVPYASFGDPQTLNLYAYVRNNPLTKADLDGHNWWDKFKNLFTDAACWCEGNKAAQSAAHNNAVRAQLNRPMSTQEKKELAVFVSTIVVFNGIVGEDGDAAAGESAAEAGEAAETTTIVAKDGTKITGLTRHGVNMAIGDTWERAGTKPDAILDAIKNPKNIASGVDQLGRPFEVFTGENARVVVNPDTGKIVSVNPMSGAGAH